MLGNDISNGVPMRVLVHLDVVTVTVTEEVPRFGRWLPGVTKTVESLFFDRVVLANLWRFSENHNVVMELFATEGTQQWLDGLLDDLDEQQAHPFRGATLYPSLRTLVSSLPFRQDVYGVIDLPERGLRYGSKWLDLSKY